MTDHSKFWKNCPMPDLSKTSLGALAWLLDEEQARWRNKVMSWDFGISLETTYKSKCGYVGCAMGLAHLTWDEQRIPDDNASITNSKAIGDLHKEIRAILEKRHGFSSPGATSQVFQQLFIHGHSSSGGTITPGTVANRIKDFLSNQPIRHI